MKIVCDNCATKYSIADEKVRGKVFKIRCKKCSHIIVVKGTEGGGAEAGVDSGAGEAPAEAPEVADGWHVVINGEQVGPLSPAEVRAKFAAGEIDAETFAWKEGYGDWLRLASIDEFRDLAASAPPPEATRRTGTDDLFGGDQGGGQAPGGDLFGGNSGDLFGGGQQAGSPGLFAQPSAPEPAPAPSRRSATPGFGAPAQNEGVPPQQAASPESGGSGGKAMTGQRNENSVLFSLNNLQALASGGNQSKPNAPVESRAGFANSQTEGSGLIDIRAMAAATLSSSPSSSSSGSADLPQFSSAPVFSPIAAPILLPAAPSGPPKWIYPVIGLGAVAVISIIVFGVLILNKKPEQVAMVTPPPAAAPPSTGTGTAPAPTATAPTPGAAAPTAPTAPTAAATPTTPAADHAGGHPGKGGGRAAKADHTAPGAKPAKADAPSAPVAAAEPPPAAPARKPSKKGDDLDALLGGATTDKPKAREQKEESGSSNEDLPDQLDKSAIVGGMSKIKGKVGACNEQFKVPGLASVAVTIGKNGKVSSATVSGVFAGTPTGDCVARAVKSATFPQFKGSPQSINYPFALH